MIPFLKKTVSFEGTKWNFRVRVSGCRRSYAAKQALHDTKVMVNNFNLEVKRLYYHQLGERTVRRNSCQEIHEA
jgi:hypothetical protein